MSGLFFLAGGLLGLWGFRHVFSLPLGGLCYALNGRL